MRHAQSPSSIASGPAVELRVLGAFAVRAPGAGADLRVRPMAARLIRRLVAARPGAVPIDELLEGLWPQHAPAAARNNLHVTVHHARRLLGPGRLLRGDETYQLVLGPDDRLDADRFADAARDALRRPAGDREPQLRAALALWAGEPLPEDRYADWARPLRDELEDLRLDVGLAAAAELRASGRAGEAVRLLRPLVARHPLDERVAAELMRALAGSGRRDEALAHFERVRDGLAASWATAPGWALRRLAQDIGRADAEGPGPTDAGGAGAAGAERATA